MKKIKMLFVFTLLCLTAFTAAHAQEARKVAVFDPAGTVDKDLLEIVREEISSGVVNTKGYTVLERQLISKVLEENKFQASGLVSDAQVSDIGKLMGADYVFVSTISKLGDNYFISCKMIEVTTARIEKQFTGTTTDGLNDIPQTAQYVVRRLFGENVKQPVTQRQTDITQPAVKPTASGQQQTSVTVMNTNDDMQLLLILKKTKVFYYTFKKGNVAWFDATSAQWYITKGLARPYYPENEKRPASAMNRKVLVEFISNKDIKHYFGNQIYQKGDLIWFNDDLGQYYVRKKVAVYKERSQSRLPRPFPHTPVLPPPFMSRHH